MMKKTYSVLIPIAGHIEISVQADNEENAIEKAWEEDDQFKLANVLEWGSYRKLVEGNVLRCSPFNEIEVIER